MNIASVGPVLELAPDARSNDGKFDFVGVRETDRAVLLKYLQARIAGKKPKPPLLVRRFKQMRARSKQARLHFDDEPWPENGKRKGKRSDNRANRLRFRAANLENATGTAKDEEAEEECSQKSSGDDIVAGNNKTARG